MTRRYIEGQTFWNRNLRKWTASYIDTCGQFTEEVIKDQDWIGRLSAVQGMAEHVHSLNRNDTVSIYDRYIRCIQSLQGVDRAPTA